MTGFISGEISSIKMLYRSHLSYVVTIVEVDQSSWCVADDEDDNDAGQEPSHSPVTPDNKCLVSITARDSEVSCKVSKSA